MKRSIFTITLAFLLAFVIGFSAVPVHVSAATTEAAQQKKIAKKFNKFLKKHFYDSDALHYDISYKKTGKRYTFTMTLTTKQMNIDYIHGAAFINDNYSKMIKALSATSKKQFKNAKILGLKKPIVNVVWISSDGVKVATIKNGVLIE